MKISEAVGSARYVVDSQGKTTEVVIPLATWKKILQSLRHLIELLEDQEDRALLTEWLDHRAAGEVNTIPLDELEKELVADGLLPG